jgi:hypothetical protein
MEHIGWSLVDRDGAEVAHWGDDAGVTHGIPNPLILPNGDQVCGLTEETTIGEYHLMKRFLVDSPPSPYHKATSRLVGMVFNSMVATVQYEEVASIVPPKVTPRQARLALLGGGKLANVKQMVNNLSEADQITWEYATEINRSDPLIKSMGAALGMTEAQIDNMFRVAVTL